MNYPLLIFFGLAPSIVGFEKVEPGVHSTATFTVYNNDTLEHVYKLSHEIPAIEQGKLAIENREGYTWIPDVSWIDPSEKEIEIAPSTHEKIELKMKLPDDERLKGRKFESLIFVEPDVGRAGFVRVRIDISE